VRRWTPERMKRPRHYVEAIPPGLVMGLVLISVVIVGWADQASGVYLSFALFYLVPVGLATWRLGRPIGVTVAVFCAIVGLIGDILTGAGAHGFVPYWNATTRLGVFVTVAVILGQLTESLDLATSLSREDPLTGAVNARWFAEVAERELAGAHRYQTPLALAYIDLDDFKGVNDTLGHSVGDELLRTVVETIASSLRPTDVLARMGGDEFAALLPRTEVEDAALAFTRIRTILMDEMKRHGWDVTFSVGIVGVSKLIGSIDDLLSYADSLMYEAKRAGKDRIVAAGPQGELRSDTSHALTG
jgi:diguanylate cyclase (GGDEF)-like protein